jgi:hypothetical protein
MVIAGIFDGIIPAYIKVPQRRIYANIRIMRTHPALNVLPDSVWTHVQFTGELQKRFNNIRDVNNRDIYFDQVRK